MKPKYHNLHLVITCTVLIVFASTYLFYILISTNNRMVELNAKIDELAASNDASVLRIESLKKQMAIDTYNLENKETQDTSKPVVKDIKKVSVIKPPAKYKQSDLNLLAQLIESEAGNQSIAGKMAVGTVVMNRVKSGVFPDTIRGVIYQKHQFSPVANGSINNKPSDESVAAAKKIMEGSRVLKSDVLYFYNPKIATDKWVRTRTVSKTIGDHVFLS